MLAVELTFEKISLKLLKFAKMICAAIYPPAYLNLYATLTDTYPILLPAHTTAK